MRTDKYLTDLIPSLLHTLTIPFSSVNNMNFSNRLVVCFVHPESKIHLLDILVLFNGHLHTYRQYFGLFFFSIPVNFVLILAKLSTMANLSVRIVCALFLLLLPAIPRKRPTLSHVCHCLVLLPACVKKSFSV